MNQRIKSIFVCLKFIIAFKNGENTFLDAQMGSIVKLSRLKPVINFDNVGISKLDC